MAVVTAQILISGAFALNEVSAPSTADSTAGLIILNDLLSSWSSDELLIPYRTVENFNLVVAQAVYTIGATANFNTVRPLSIADAYIKDSSGTDYQLDVLMSKNQYDSIEVKSTAGRPARLYYDPQYPSGKIYFDLTPNTIEVLYLDSWKALTELAALATDVTLPDFYKKAIKYNLAVDLAPILGRDLSPLVIVEADKCLRMMRDVNSQTINEMRIDSALRYMA